jgi:carbon monoxide dehydrogenase subunit G
MLLPQRVRGYEQQLARFFDSANDCGFSIIGGRSNYFVSGTARVAREPSPDSARVNYSFDISKQ